MMMQYFRRRSPDRHSDRNGGFTLIEILVIVIIVSILSAIAAPGWLAFMNNRRISTVRSQAADAIRKAQNDAKTTQTSRALILDEKSDPPRLAIVRCGAAGVTSARTECALPNLATLDWQTLGGGDVKRGSVAYTKVTQEQTSPANYVGQNADYARLVFDGNGVVNRSLSDVPAATANGTSDALFIIGFRLSGPGNENAQPRCLIVQTLLGGLREGNSIAPSECRGL